MCFNTAAMAYLSWHIVLKTVNIPGLELRTTLFTCIFVKGGRSIDVTFVLLGRPGNRCQVSVGHGV